MTDGTVMVSDTCMSSWYSLSPDQNGNYVNGTWTKKASLPSGYAPLYFASAVLPDGKLIINGGEYNFCKTAETTLGAIYDPGREYVDAGFTAERVAAHRRRAERRSRKRDVHARQLLHRRSSALRRSDHELDANRSRNGKQDANSEEGWTLLRNGDLLTVDISHTPYAEAYAPTANAWSSAGQLPVNLIAASEIGAQTLLPNDSVFVAGATGHTALYAEKSGMWTQGPDFPVVSSQQLDVADGPSVLLTNGTVMIPASPGIYHAPSYFFIFNGKKLAAIAAPPNAVNDSSYDIRLLLLPNGQVLETDGSGDVEVYTANVKPETKIAPVITSVATTLTHGSTYKIAGKRFNGFSQAEGYGDDDQQATNYPLVRIVNNATGHVVLCAYARTQLHGGRIVAQRLDDVRRSVRHRNGSKFVGGGSQRDCVRGRQRYDPVTANRVFARSFALAASRSRSRGGALLTRSPNKSDAASGHALDRAVERRFVGFRGVRETAQLSYELNRGCADLLGRGRRREVMKRLDVSAHTAVSAARPNPPCRSA